MLQNLPQDAKMKLISMYNTMLNTGRYPHIWRSAIIVPIAKPNKPHMRLVAFAQSLSYRALAKSLKNAC